MASVSRNSSADNGFAFSKGVPLIGQRMLTGIDTGSIRRRATANSARCFMFSPMPIIPPEQISNPIFLAASMVWILSSAVWVVHSVEKNSGAASRLQWYRRTPASHSFCNSSEDRSPSDAQVKIPTSSLIRRSIEQILSKATPRVALPDATIENLCTPASLLIFAARIHSFSSTRS